MNAEKFNEYLEHDGITDMLEWRKSNNALDKDATEEYSKHVKTIFQVGEKITDDYKTILGYPIEFVPLENPYSLHPGHDLQVQLLFQGKPLSNQLVYTGFQAGIHTHSHEGGQTHEDGQTHEHTHSPTDTTYHQHDHSSGLRTDEQGIVKVSLKEEGIFYMRTINLVNTDRDSLTHISNWATLTFAVGHGHAHDHSYEEKHIHSIPMYVYFLGSLALVGALFFWFNKNK